MKQNQMRVLTVLITVVTALLLPAGEAAAQSEQELRREVEQLKERNRELERELEAAHHRVAALEQAIERLNERLRSMRDAQPDRDRPDDEPEVTIDESEPHASPRALFNAIQESYAEAMADVEIGEAGDRQRSIYMRTLERWLARTNRELRGQVKWHVQVLESESTRGGYTLNVVAIDPKTDARLGEPFDLNIPRRLARRYEQLVERRRAERLFVRGALTPDVRVNPDRREPGTFNVPPLIGPFAEFAFRIDVSAVTEPGDDEDEQRGRR